MFQKLSLFLNDSKKEFGRINWPTPQETSRLTLVVVLLSLLFAVFLGLFDFLFLIGLEYLL